MFNTESKGLFKLVLIKIILLRQYSARGVKNFKESCQ